MIRGEHSRGTSGMTGSPITTRATWAATTLRQAAASAAASIGCIEVAPGLDRDLLKAISLRERKHNLSPGSLTVDGVLSTGARLTGFRSASPSEHVGRPGRNASRAAGELGRGTLGPTCGRRLQRCSRDSSSGISRSKLRRKT